VVGVDAAASTLEFLRGTSPIPFWCYRGFIAAFGLGMLVLLVALVGLFVTALYFPPTILGKVACTIVCAPMSIGECMEGSLAL